MSIEVEELQLMNRKEFEDSKFQEKFKMLRKFWGIREHLIQGTVSLIDELNMEITELKSLDSKKILSNPFTGEFLSISIYTKYHSQDIEKLNLAQGDKIVFEFMPKNKILNSDSILNIKEKTIVKLSDEMDIYSQVGIEPKVMKDLIKTKDLKSKNDELKNQNKNLKNQNEELENIINKNNESLNSLNNYINLLRKEEEKYIELGILKAKNQEHESKEKVNINREEYIDYIVKYLGCSYKKHLYYNKTTIEKLYAGLSTNQLVILSGSPGTGKTSLVEGFCDAVGAKKKLVSVQPNWTETQDLLGFYNPVEKKYISTPFLDFLLEAKNNKDNLYIVCLDEMNLAHVEYYFAEFLSKLESTDRELELYSETIYYNNIEETDKQIDLITKIYNIKTDDDSFNIDDISTFERYSDLKSKRKNYFDYNCKLTIPENIRFVGTINKDETTKNLSPKVVDRSFIMEVDKYNKEVKEDIINNIEEYKMKYNKVLNLTPSDFKTNRIEIKENVLSKLINMKALLEKDLQVNLNNRFFRQVEEIIGSKILNEEEILDYIVLTKIIPKINVYIEEENEEKINRFEELIKDLSNSKKAFDEMKLGWEETEVLTFWR